jgi:hypothetical protein
MKLFLRSKKSAMFIREIEKCAMFCTDFNCKATVLNNPMRYLTARKRVKGTHLKLIWLFPAPPGTADATKHQLG